MIYLDNASTTKPYLEVINIYEKYVNNNYFNNSAIYKAGKNNLFLEEKIKENLLKLLKLKNKKIIFTSSASEANNLAIKGFFENKDLSKFHAITTESEHKSVLEIFKYLEKKGLNVSYITINKNGEINLNELKNTIKENTIFCSLMLTNNETGNILNIKEVYNILKTHKILFHSDMSQSFLKTNLELLSYCDMFSISSHKIHGLKSVAALIINENINLQPLILGGGQEYNFRSSTVDIPLIASFYKAIEIGIKNYNTKKSYIKSLFNYLYDELKNHLDIFSINSSNKNNSYFILNFSTINIKSSVIIEELSNNEIYVSSVSACNSKKETFSQTVYLQTKNLDLAKNTIRVSFSYENTIKELENFLNKLIETIKKYKNKEF